MEPGETFRALVRFIMRDTLYHGDYVATVELQHDDDTLDVRPDDERVRGNGLSRVPIRHGLPGVRVRVVAGARVLLGFEAGDPQRPYCALWEGSGALESLQFDGGTAPIARVGDAVVCYWPAVVPVTGSIILAGIPCAFRGTMTITTPSAGIIETGAQRVKA